jgi:hypothetical protein
LGGGFSNHTRLALRTRRALYIEIQSEGACVKGWDCPIAPRRSPLDQAGAQDSRSPTEADGDAVIPV